MISGSCLPLGLLFESAIPRFESWRPSQASSDLGSGLGRRRKTDSRGFPFPGSPFGEPEYVPVRNLRHAPRARQSHRDGGAAPRLACEFQRPSVQLDQTLRERKSKPGTLVFAR